MGAGAVIDALPPRPDAPTVKHRGGLARQHNMVSSAVPKYRGIHNASAIPDQGP